MYALGLSVSALASLPFFRLGQLDVGIPIQAFGVIVAIGVLIGAGLLRRYAEWHGIEDDHIRGLTAEAHELAGEHCKRRWLAGEP